MSAPDAFPSQQVVSEEFHCPLMGGCSGPSSCWTAGHCLRERARFPDPKKGQRKRDSAAIRQKLLAVRECYGCERAAAEGHHIVFRSHGGDDVVENIAPLCKDCHVLVHFALTEESQLVRRRIGEYMLANDMAAIEYVLGKLGIGPGQEYLRRHYFIGVPAAKVRELRAALVGDRTEWRDRVRDQG